MSPSARPPWSLLLSKLQRADPARVSYAEILADGAQPSLLVAEGVAEYGALDDYAPEGCAHGCVPNIDYDRRASESLVGVACPNDEACWPGWRWVARDEALTLRASSTQLFGALREENGLLPLELPPSVRGATAIGRLKRRGLDVPVVWMRARRDFFLSALGLRQQLGGDGLIVVVPKHPGVHFAADEQIAVLELPTAHDGHLGLVRGLDQLDPIYRKKAAGRDEPDAEVDWVRLHFATTEARHVLLVNDHDFVGFRQGDVQFARLLLLAAARKFTRRGWIHKASLVGDFAAKPAATAIKPADKALEKLRGELVADDVPGLTEDEQDAILKAGRGTSKLRLSVLPENITFDDSLASMTWKIHATTRGRALSGKQAEGVTIATLLLAEARRLGVPGEIITVPSPVPATSRATRRRRSAL
jgi:hypothetical protein